MFKNKSKRKRNFIIRYFLIKSKPHERIALLITASVNIYQTKIPIVMKTCFSYRKPMKEFRLTHSICFCIDHQNVALLVDAMDWDFTHKDLINKIVSNTESNKCIMHQFESCPGNANLK